MEKIVKNEARRDFLKVSGSAAGGLALAFYLPTARQAQAADGGSPNATQHANRIWKQLLDEYQQPAMPADRLEQLDAYMTRRKREIGQGSW